MPSHLHRVWASDIPHAHFCLLFAITTSNCSQHDNITENMKVTWQITTLHTFCEPDSPANRITIPCNNCVWTSCELNVPLCMFFIVKPISVFKLSFSIRFVGLNFLISGTAVTKLRWRCTTKGCNNYVIVKIDSLKCETLSHKIKNCKISNYLLH